MRKAYMAIAIAVLIGGAAPLHALAQSATEINATLDNLFGEHDPYRKFFDQLKAAVAADDRAINDGLPTIDNSTGRH